MGDPRTWEQADVPVLVLALPPLVGGGFNFDDAIALAERQLIVLSRVIAITQSVNMYHYEFWIGLTRRERLRQCLH